MRLDLHLRSLFFRVFPLIVFLLPNHAFSGGRVGAGGGSIVCKDPKSGKVLDAAFYDLYEQRRFLTPGKTTGIESLAFDTGSSPRDEAENILKSLSAFFPGLYRYAIDELNRVDAVIQASLVKLNADRLANPNYVFPTLNPNEVGEEDPFTEMPEDCPMHLSFVKGIKPAFEFAGIHRLSSLRGADTLDFSPNPEIYEAFSKQDKVGFLVHESWYAVYRAFFYVGSSKPIRESVGYALLSDVPWDVKANFIQTKFTPWDLFRAEFQDWYPAWIGESWMKSAESLIAELESRLHDRRHRLLSYWKLCVLKLREGVMKYRGRSSSTAIYRIFSGEDRFFVRESKEEIDPDVNLPLPNILNQSPNQLYALPMDFYSALLEEEWLPLPVAAFLITDKPYGSHTDPASLIALSKTFDPNYASKTGLTPLIAATLRNEVDFVDTVLGAPMTRIDAVWKPKTVIRGRTEGWTALRLAQELGFNDLVNLYLGYPANRMKGNMEGPQDGKDIMRDDRDGSPIR